MKRFKFIFATILTTILMDFMNKVIKRSVVLAIFLFASSGMFAQADMGFKGIGGKVVYVDVENSSESPVGFGAFAEFGTFAPNFHLEGNIDFWSKEASGVKNRDQAIGGTVKYVHEPEGQKFRPFALGGLHFHRFVVANQNNESNSSTKIGFDLGGGLYYELSPTLDLMAELRYLLISDVNNMLHLGVGLQFRMGK